MELNYKDIGQRVKAARKAMGITQQILAEQTDLTPTNISHIENGRTKAGLPTLMKLANALELTLDELVCDSLDKAKTIFQNEIMRETEDCSEEEVRIIADTVKALKVSLRKRSEARE